MIDFETYLQLNPNSIVAATAKKPENRRVAMAPSRSASDYPPNTAEIYLFPPQIAGYNLQIKKWRTY